MIYGEKVRLRLVEEQDLKRLVAWRNDPKVRRGFFTTFPLSQGGQRAWYEDLLKRQDRKLFIVETGEGVPVGTVGLDHIDWKNQKAEFGNALIAREHWGHGYGTDAARTLVRFGFEELNLNRIYLEVYAWNETAIRVYEKCGFQVEGVLRQNFFAGGQFHDTVLMALLRDRWKGTQLMPER